MTKAGGGGRKESLPRARRVDVNLEFDSMDQLGEYMSNVSRSGAFVRTRDPWPVGTKLRMRFTILLDDPEVFEGMGKVVRVSERPRGMGMVFVELTEATRHLLERVLTRKAIKRRG